MILIAVAMDRRRRGLQKLDEFATAVTIPFCNLSFELRLPTLKRPSRPRQRIVESTRKRSFAPGPPGVLTTGSR